VILTPPPRNKLGCYSSCLCFTSQIFTTILILYSSPKFFNLSTHFSVQFIPNPLVSPPLHISIQQIPLYSPAYQQFMVSGSNMLRDLPSDQKCKSICRWNVSPFLIFKILFQFELIMRHSKEPNSPSVYP
jgi:hypothetical protein